jgi:hypothetical protein
MTIFEAIELVDVVSKCGTTAYNSYHTFEATNIYVFVNKTKYEKVFIGQQTFYRTTDFDFMLSKNRNDSDFIHEQDLKWELIKKRFK